VGPRTSRALELVVRASAVGVVLGLVAALVTIARSPDLVAAPGKALRFAGPVVCVYLGLAWGAAALLAALGGALSLVGAPARALVSAPAFWALGLLALAHTSLNIVARETDLVDTLKGPLRGAMLSAAVLAVGWSLWRRPEAGAGVRRLERALACLAPPAALLALAFFASGPAPRGPAREGEIIAPTPRFAPEPGPVLAAAAAGPRSRVLVVGLDGASWDRIERGVAAGRLPTFERLVLGGRRAPLGTLYPTHSPLIWNTIATGVPPEEHGIEDFYLTQLPRLDVELLRIPHSLDLLEDALQGLGELRRVPVTSGLRRRKALWNLADEAGLRSAVIGFWASWPPEPLRHGVVVSDHASLARRREWLDRGKTSTLTAGSTTHPPGLAAELAPLQRSPDSVTREELARFLPVDDAVWHEFQAVREFSKEVDLSAFRSSHLNDSFYLAAARRLWDAQRPDLLFVYARAIDELSHFFYEAGVPEAARLGRSPEEIARYAGVVDRVYEWTDAELAPLVDAVDRDGDAVLIVVSDHGWEREPDGGYNHNFRPPGILLVYGAGVCAKQCPPLGDATVFDVAPTVLERLRLPLSEELRGRPLVEAFDEARPVIRVAEYGRALGRARNVASDVDEELTEKLEALGYVE
jgi:hypothetical protein